MANRALAHLSKLFNWLCEQDVIAASPCAGVKRPSAENARDRVLSDREFVALWRALDAVDEPARSWVRLLILLGQRRSEVGGMRRSEIDGDIVANSGRSDEKPPRPLVAAAGASPGHHRTDAAEGRRPHFFRGRQSHLDAVKRAIDAEMKPATPWVWHDIRRTVATGMAGLGVAVPTIEKILAHRSGTFRGIVGTYQRHSFIPEMRSALERWSEHVDRLVQGVPASKVVPIGRR